MWSIRFNDSITTKRKDKEYVRDNFINILNIYEI